MILHEGAVELLEAAGRRWRVLLISAGKSKNSRGLEYPADTLKAAVQEGVFDGIAAKALRFDRIYAHLPRILKQAFPQGFADVVVGGLHEAKWDESLQGVTATLELVEGVGWFESLLKLSQRLGGKVFGWSIDGDGKLREGSETVVDRILSVDSVDFVTAAARGGRTLEPLEEQLLESFAAASGGPKGGTMKERIRKMLERVRRLNASLLEGVEVESLVESEDLDKALELLEAALKQPEPKPKPADTKPADDPTAKLQEAMDAMQARALGNIRLEEALTKADLPDECKAVIRRELTDKSPADAAIQEAITGQVKLVKKLRPEQPTGRREVLLNEQDKLAAGLAGLLECTTDEEKVTVGRGFRGLQEAYVRITGDSDLSGRVNLAKVGLEEAALASDTWTNIWQTVGSRRLAKKFAQLPGIARMIASSIRGTSDFKYMEIGEVGGYGVLPAVPQGGAYTDLGVPGDRKVRYSVSKRGGTVSVTMEAVRNDDIGGIARMIDNLARAARNTEESIAINSAILANPTWADNVALFAAGRGNLYTTQNFTTDAWLTLAAIFDGLWAVTLTDLKATTTDVETLGLQPYHMIIGKASKSGLIQVLNARDRKVGGAYWDSSAEVEHYTEANEYFQAFGAGNERVHVTNLLSISAVTAVAVANPAEAETIELAYLDNKREPELFRADNPSLGSMFTNDAMDLKIRFILGAQVIDPRSFFGVYAP